MGDLLKYKIHLTEEEIIILTKIIKTGKNSARKITRAWILLKSHEGLKYGEIIEELKVSKRLILKVRKRFCESGLDHALNENPRPGQPRIVIPEVEVETFFRKIYILNIETKINYSLKPNQNR